MTDVQELPSHRLTSHAFLVTVACLKLSEESSVSTIWAKQLPQDSGDGVYAIIWTGPEVQPIKTTL